MSSNNTTSIPHTIEEFILEGESSSAVTYFSTSILSGDNGIKYSVDNVVFDYLDEIKDLKLQVKLNASDYKKYKQDGVFMLAYNVYGTRDVAYLILALNGIYNPQEFTMNPIYMLRKSDLISVLEAIKNAEKEYLAYNREQNGM
jgi:hypothetical protein